MTSYSSPLWRVSHVGPCPLLNSWLAGVDPSLGFAAVERDVPSLSLILIQHQQPFFRHGMTWGMYQSSPLSFLPPAGVVWSGAWVYEDPVLRLYPHFSRPLCWEANCLWSLKLRAPKGAERGENPAIKSVDRFVLEISHVMTATKWYEGLYILGPQNGLERFLSIGYAVKFGTQHYRKFYGK